MPEVALVPLPLLLVDQEGFKALLQALIDISKLLQVFRLLESIWSRIIVMLRSKCTSIRLNASLASASDGAPIRASKLLRLMYSAHSFFTPWIWCTVSRS